MSTTGKLGTLLRKRKHHPSKAQVEENERFKATVKTIAEQREEARERLQSDVEKFLAKGGTIDTLPGPPERITIVGSAKGWDSNFVSSS